MQDLPRTKATLMPMEPFGFADVALAVYKGNVLLGVYLYRTIVRCMQNTLKLTDYKL